jgi:hypothetical protein
MLLTHNDKFDICLSTERENSISWQFNDIKREDDKRTTRILTGERSI